MNEIAYAMEFYGKESGEFPKILNRWKALKIGFFSFQIGHVDFILSHGLKLFVNRRSSTAETLHVDFLTLLAICVLHL